MTTSSNLQVGLLAAAMAVSLAPISAMGATVPVPDAAGGSVSVGQRSTPRPLSTSETTAVTTCLRRHSTGWQTNMATPPTPTATVALDAAGQSPGVRLSLWPGPKYLGWTKSVLAETTAGRPIGIQDFSPAELAPLLGVVGQ